MTVIARLRKHTRAATTALTGINTAIAEVRAEIAAVQNQMAKLEDRPVDRATIEATLDHGLEGLAGRGSYAFKLLARRLTGWGGEGSHFEIADDDLGPMMVAMLRDQLRAGALAAVAQVMGSDTGITEEERDTERARLEGEVLALELAEEALIREAEAAGLSIPRRTDMHPAAELAPASALPEL